MPTPHRAASMASSSGIVRTLTSMQDEGKVVEEEEEKEEEEEGRRGREEERRGGGMSRSSERRKWRSTRPLRTRERSPVGCAGLALRLRPNTKSI